MPSIPRIFAPPASGGREASPQDFGVERTQGIGQVSRAVRELGDTAATLYEGDQTAKVGRAVSAATLELQDLQTRLAQDQNYETHAEVFEKSRDAILKRHGEGFNPRFQGEFRDRVTPLAGRIAIDVRTSVRAKQIDTAIANIDQNELDLGRLAAEAPDPAQRAGYRGEYAIQVRDLVRAGYLSAQDATNRLQRFEKTVASADWLRSAEADPEDTLHELADPTSPLLQGLDAAEVEERRKQTLGIWEHQLQEQRAATEFRYQQQQRAEKDAADETRRTADELFFGGKLDQLQAYLAKTRNVMDPERRGWYLERLAKGGGDGDPKTNPRVYLSLQQQALEGRPVFDDARRQYEAGELTQPDMLELQKLSRDSKFTPVLQELRSVLRVDDIIKLPDPEQEARAASAVRAFTDWMRAHPNASHEEAIAYKDQLVRYVGRSALLQNPPPPNFAPESAATALFERAARGEISGAELAEGLQQIQATEKAQQQAETPK